MVEAQAQVARWVTEQKRHADTVALKGQRMLQTDKGAPLAQPLPPALTCGSRRAPMCRATAAHCLRAKPRCLRSVRARNACLHAVIECDADTRPSRFASTVAAFAENIDQLREELDALGSAEDALQQQSGAERNRVDELRAELERLTAQESRLPPEAERLNQQLEQTRSLVTRREVECSHIVKEKDQKLAELDKGRALYRSRLGLNFEQVGGERLRLTFTNVDAANPMRAFAFQVFVDGGDTYHVESCEPPVAGMDELVDALNKDNDFSLFVRQMRKRFKQLC